MSALLKPVRITFVPTCVYVLDHCYTIVTSCIGDPQGHTVHVKLENVETLAESDQPHKQLSHHHSYMFNQVQDAKELVPVQR